MQPLHRLEAALFGRLRRGRKPTRLGTVCLRLAFYIISALVLGTIFRGVFSTICHAIADIFAVALVPCLLILIVRWIFRKILWTVRSRLIVTCLLLGMVPLVLLPVLGGIAAYLLFGQFATRIALSALDSAITRVQEDSANVLSLAAQSEVYSSQAGSSIRMPELEENARPVLVSAWRDGKQLGLRRADAAGQSQPSPFAAASPPAWLKPGFKGLVETPNLFFLCGASGGSTGGHSLLTVACSPFGSQEVATLASGLGSLRFKPHVDVDTDDDAVTQPMSAGDDSHHGVAVIVKRPKSFSTTDAPSRTAASPPPPLNTARLQGGTLPAGTNILDVPVYFSAPMQMKNGLTGADDEGWLFVTSRPQLLYRHLFATSMQSGEVVRIVLLVIAVVFAALELLACLMAVALSRTITRSIADLYTATQQIDKGDLDHLIPVRRRDQLSALAASFNTMTGSLKALLKEQREKDRMQNELNIAREVQENLFPHGAIDLPGLELYGVCEAARTIGGDYYDFIPNGTSQLYLALGDISGKGISAALLMASLHSAVRAYCEEGFPELQASLPAPQLMEGLSPGRLLALLNRHLFASTQPEKYATLFLAHYDSSTRLLTYSNGGHLPPLLLSAGGEVQRLDCGGSVIGLFDGLEYSEATIPMNQGDLLVLYSDGLTEPERGTTEFGEGRLLEVVRAYRRRPLREIAAHTFAAVHTWIGESEQPDDMTVVLARLD